MKAKDTGMTRHMFGALCVSAVLISILLAPCPVLAQRNNTSPIYAWSGMNNNFRHTNSDGSQYWVQTQGGTTANSFWTVGSSRVDLQACKLEYSIVSPK